MSLYQLPQGGPFGLGPRLDQHVEAGMPGAHLKSQKWNVTRCSQPQKLCQRGSCALYGSGECGQAVL
eukprot:1207369-Amphidinium_carterae.1